MTLADDERLDAAAVAALYLAHAEELRRFLVGVIRDVQLANDVLQIAFAKLLERGHETREDARKAWLFRVAYHEALAIRRREAVGEKVTRRGAWGKEGATGGTEDNLVRFEVVEGVREALKDLPPEQQQVVRMRIYDERTFAEIAQALDIPLGTALGRMRSALQKLRNKLGDSNL